MESNPIPSAAALGGLLVRLVTAVETIAETIGEQQPPVVHNHVNIPKPRSVRVVERHGVKRYVPEEVD